MGNYSLRLQPIGGGQSTLLDTLPGVIGSWERTENRWGFFQGVFSVQGALTQLIEWHRLWLGRDVTERVGGTAVWQGYVHELRLYHGDVCRVYGYDIGGETDNNPAGMFNAVRVAIGNLVENAEFEIDGAGPPVFAYWPQLIGSGDSIGKETTDPITGGQSPKLTNGGSGTTHIAQSITVRPQTAYSIRFVSAGDGSVSGRYRIMDKTNDADIVPLTSADNTGLGQFRGVTEEIVTPADCLSLAIMFYAPATAGYAVFDSVDVRRVEEGDRGHDYTEWAVQEQSVDRHGRRELIVEGDGLTPLEAAEMRDSVLAARCWPQERQTNGDGTTRLEVYCLGQIHRAGWLHTDETLHGKTAEASAHVASIAAKLPWVTASAVQDNDLSISLPETPQTLLDALRFIVGAGGAAAQMWRLWAESGRLLYAPVNFTPTLSMSGGQLYRRLGDRETADIRLIRAMSVVRDFDFPDRSLLPGSQLQQRNDSLLESITVGAQGMRREIGGL